MKEYKILINIINEPPTSSVPEPGLLGKMSLATGGICGATVGGMKMFEFVSETVKDAGTPHYLFLVSLGIYTGVGLGALSAEILRTAYHGLFTKNTQGDDQ